MSIYATPREIRQSLHTTAISLSGIGCGSLNAVDKQLVYKAQRLLDEVRSVLFEIKDQDLTGGI